MLSFYHFQGQTAPRWRFRRLHSTFRCSLEVPPDGDIKSGSQLRDSDDPSGDRASLNLKESPLAGSNTLSSPAVIQLPNSDPELLAAFTVRGKLLKHRVKVSSPIFYGMRHIALSPNHLLPWSPINHVLALKDNIRTLRTSGQTVCA